MIDPVSDAPDVPEPPIQPLPVTLQVSVDQTTDGFPIVMLSASVGGVLAGIRLAPELALLVAKHLNHAVERIILCSGPTQGSA